MGTQQDALLPHPAVGKAARRPTVRGWGEPVDDKLPQAFVVLGEVVEGRLRERRRRTVVPDFAVEVARAVDLETELDTAVARIETGQRNPGVVLVIWILRVVAPALRSATLIFRASTARQSGFRPPPRCSVPMLRAALARSSRLDEK